MPIPPPPPSEPLRVEEMLAGSLSLVELTQETIRQAQGPGAKGMVEELIQQCEKYSRTAFCDQFTSYYYSRDLGMLRDIVGRSAESNDFMLFEQAQKVKRKSFEVLRSSSSLFPSS